MVVLLHEGMYILTLALKKGTQQTVDDALPVVYLFMHVPCHTLQPSYAKPPTCFPTALLLQPKYWDRTLHPITVQFACVPLQQQVLVAAVVTD